MDADERLRYYLDNISKIVSGKEGSKVIFAADNSNYRIEVVTAPNSENVVVIVPTENLNQNQIELIEAILAKPSDPQTGLFRREVDPKSAAEFIEAIFLDVIGLSQDFTVSAQLLP